MKQKLFPAIIFTALFLCAAIGYFGGVAITEKRNQFYDGEGNEIPKKVVKLYVLSHFVYLDSTEQKQVNQYFY